MNCMSLCGIVFIIFITKAEEVLYMDKFGHCNMGGYYAISEETVKLKARGGEPYKTKICQITFSAARNEQICIFFDKYDVKDRVHLEIYDNKESLGSPKFSFGPHSTPKPFCSDGRYVTLKLDKENYMSTNYQFEIRIVEGSQVDFVDGLDGFVMSIGVIIAIIIGVVVLITVFAIVIVCCCCNSGGNRCDNSRMKSKRHSAPATQTANERPAIVPSAPPLQEVQYGRDGYHSVPIQERFPGEHDPPPAYSAEPPPYTTTTDVTT